jgi:hypothetical protein
VALQALRPPHTVADAVALRDLLATYSEVHGAHVAALIASVYIFMQCFGACPPDTFTWCKLDVLLAAPRGRAHQTRERGGIVDRCTCGRSHTAPTHGGCAAWRENGPT